MYLTRGDSEMPESKDQEQHWKDIPPHEREAILKLARLDPKRLECMIEAGRRLEWWYGLADRVRLMKWIVVALGLFVSYVSGGLDALAAWWIGD